MADVSPLHDVDDQSDVRCDACGVIFAVPAAMEERHRRVGRSIWCPNGHLLGSDFREPLGLTLQRTQDLASELGSELALERAAHRQTRRALIETRHRLMLGLCPACAYTAKGLGKHLCAAHPDYDTADV